MVSFSTWRSFYRIPLIRKNRKAIRILRDMFYVLIALYRISKMQEFSLLGHLYFKMIDSFAQYGSVEAKDTVDQILEIPWFRDNQRNLYRLLSSYNNVIQNINSNGNQFYTKSTQEQLNRDMNNFFQAYKSLNRFDEKDEKRISELLQNRNLLDEITRNLYQSLGGR